MNKTESLNFLQNCINTINNMNELEVENLKQIYENEMKNKTIKCPICNNNRVFKDDYLQYVFGLYEKGIYDINTYSCNNCGYIMFFDENIFKNYKENNNDRN